VVLLLANFWHADRSLTRTCVRLPYGPCGPGNGTTPTLAGRSRRRSTDTQRLWQVLTMRDGKIVHIHDYTNQATALQAAGLPTGP